MKQVKAISLILALLIVTALLTGCTTDMPYDENRAKLEIDFNDNLGMVEVEGEEIEPEDEFIYEQGTEITLEAIPEDGAEFVEWVGINETDKKITIIMEEDLSLYAEFAASAEVEVTIECDYLETYIARMDEVVRAEELYIELIKEDVTVETLAMDIDDNIADTHHAGITVEEAGVYDIEVKLKGYFGEGDTTSSLQSQDLKTFYQGNKEDVELEPDSGKRLNIPVNPRTAESLTVKMESPDDGVLGDLDRLELEHASSLTERSAVKEYVGDVDKGKVIFEDGEIYNDVEFQMTPGRWDLELVFEINSQEIRKEVDGIILLPRENKIIELEVTKKAGDIELTVVISQSPTAPENLDVVFDEEADEDYLVWDWNGDKVGIEFTILRSETDDLDEVDYLEPVTQESIEEMRYPLEKLDEGYWYWVRAYDSAGRSSELSYPPLYLSEGGEGKR